MMRRPDLVSKVSKPENLQWQQRRRFQVSRNEGSVCVRDMEANLSSHDEEISGLENIGTWGLELEEKGLELEEKAMATDDKIQVSRNEGSVLGTRRL
jgi:hypothetical protein